MRIEANKLTKRQISGVWKDIKSFIEDHSAFDYRDLLDFTEDFGIASIELSGSFYAYCEYIRNKSSYRLGRAMGELIRYGVVTVNSKDKVFFFLNKFVDKDITFLYYFRSDVLLSHREAEERECVTCSVLMEILVSVGVSKPVVTRHLFLNPPKMSYSSNKVTLTNYAHGDIFDFFYCLLVGCRLDKTKRGSYTFLRFFNFCIDFIDQIDFNLFFSSYGVELKKAIFCYCTYFHTDEVAGFFEYHDIYLSISNRVDLVVSRKRKEYSELTDEELLALGKGM